VSITSELIVPEHLSGQRLDRVLLALCPKLSLRARRRMTEDGLVLVNGRRACCATKLCEGDSVCLCQKKSVSHISSAKFLAKDGDILFFFKPRGLHTECLAGSTHASLEALVPELYPQAEDVRLVQRLDLGTSGIVSAICSREAHASFRTMEEAGNVQKKYFALLEGKLTRPRQAKMALDTRKRTQTKLQSAEAPWSRWTSFIPLAIFAEGSPLPPWLNISFSAFPCDLTLAGCSIHRGARHQIRAHAAGLGHPLFGDSLYGGRPHAVFFLHQAFVAVGESRCLCLPDWLVEDSLPSEILSWLRGF